MVGMVGTVAIAAPALVKETESVKTFWITNHLCFLPSGHLRSILFVLEH